MGMERGIEEREHVAALQRKVYATKWTVSICEKGEKYRLSHSNDYIISCQSCQGVLEKSFKKIKKLCVNCLT